MKSVKGKALRGKIAALIVLVWLLLLHPSPFTLHPVYAEVNIGNEYGFGEFKSLGEGVSKLTNPAFEISAVAVIIYFLLGALKYLMSGGKKEEIEGARNMITHAIIGFILLMFAFLIIQFLLSSLFGETGLRIV